MNSKATDEDIAARVEEKMSDEAAMNSEIVANVVAELMSSEKFLKRYAQMGEEQSSVVKKIARFVKGIAKALKEKDNKASAVAADMMKLVDKALGSEVAGEKTGGKTSFDISPDEAREWEKPITMDDVETLRSIGRKSINSFSAEDIKKAQKWAYKFYKELGIKSPFFRAWFGDWRQYERSNFVNILKMEHREGKNPRGQYKNSDTGWVINSSSVGYDETISHSGKDKKSILAMQNIDKIIESAVLLDTEVSEYGRGKKSVYTAFMHKFYALINIDGEKYIAKMAVDESHAPGQNDTNKKFYHVRAIEIETASSVGIGKSHTPIMEDTVSTVSIADLFEIVKRNDKEFTPNSVNKYMLNEDGTPKVFFHGTNADFTVFDNSKIGSNTDDGVYGKGFYFSSYRNQSKQYGKLMSCYLALKNPLVLTDYSSIEELADILDMSESNFSESGGIIRPRYSFVSQFTSHVKSAKFDGVIVNYGTSDEVVVFDNTQIKSADKAGTEKANIGTFDKSEPDIRYDLDPEAVEREAERLTPKTEKTEKKKAESSTSGIKTGSAEAGRYSRGMRYEFGLDKKFEAAIRSRLEALEEVFIKGDREAYVEEYKKRVEEIFDIVRREGVVEVATDNSYRGFLWEALYFKFNIEHLFLWLVLFLGVWRELAFGGSCYNTFYFYLSRVF